ncbi:hypothetical protein AN964_24965 [Heyndrickxia shackletonii]|uniref:DUF1129 family protein n=1 Tax=Heyndrickxia shackletonii TaxID=157838 RepID=A0A0Q3WSJ0_9BACI|nr:DUF1129 family protein [Heyndrickxia shackletonii]KQL50866.1 hypothetical protein AN964_24965 [Heyndrickxia shackletonii]NEZ01749.1 DUF1129 family protein [Heyndrickxia shackletonii]
MKAKQLIEENNRKRELLTPENKQYYSDMLIYIRLNLSLSEQHSEEVLMEMLDHLLEGQQEGKSARDIFGDDPKRYADEIIQNLPNGKKREVVPLLLGIIFHLISWILIVRGIAILVTSQFRNIGDTVYPLSSLIIFAIILASVLFGVWLIFRVIQQSLFNQNPNEKKSRLMVGIFVALSTVIVVVASMFIPRFGPTFHFTWWASLLAGGILWIIVYTLRRINVGVR